MNIDVLEQSFAAIINSNSSLCNESELIVLDFISNLQIIDKKTFQINY